MAVRIIEEAEEKDEYTPFFIRDKFNTCIPENWKVLVKQWIRIKAKNFQNQHTMSLVYNSMLSVSKSLDNSAPKIPCDASVFSVSFTEAQKEWNLSMNKQPAVNIGPSDSPGSPQKEEHEDFEENNEELVRDENRSVVTDDPLAQDDDEDVSIAHDDMTNDSPKGENAEVEVDVSTLRHKKRQKTSIDETLNLEDDRTYCRNCNMTFRNYKSHYGSKYHQKVVEEQKTCPEIIGPLHDYNPNMTYACEACRFSTDDMKIIMAHIELNNHKMKTTKRDKSILFCNLCSCFSGTRRDEDFFRHLHTKMHKCNMQAVGMKPNDERTKNLNYNLGKYEKKSRVSRKARRE